MLMTFGLLALGLAVAGVYGVKSYLVSRRTREIGIRMALGAEPRNVLGDVMLRGMALTAAGLAVGMAAAFATIRLAASMLVNVSSTDLASYLGAGVFLMAVGLLASYVPARRATKVDPIRALRCE